MPLKPLVLLNVVGLAPRHLAGPDTPRLSALGKSGAVWPMKGVTPAVTCTAQATMLTGLPPQGHGIVANGWLFRETAEVRFWLQSNRLMSGETLYAAARRMAAERGERFTCAKMFWWFNQGAAVDWSVTPKPHYGADGSKVYDIQSTPDDLAGELQSKLGAFPFFGFWGPMAGLPSSRWIADASAHVLRTRKPTLTLVYLPHLDYDLQRFGPDAACVPERLREVDACAGTVLDAAAEIGAEVMVVSEYGLTPVRRVVHPNRVLREAGLLTARKGPFGELIDLFNSPAVAVADHQVAHVYVRDSHDAASVARVADLLGSQPGVVKVLTGPERAEVGLDHNRAGDIVAISETDAWFAYHYWLDDSNAPDFARTVDIHRKPGYDPCELFLDPRLTFPRLRVARRLAAKALGFRYLMDVIPLDASLVKGSHGAEPADAADGPVVMAGPGAVDAFRRDAITEPGDRVAMTAVRDAALRAMGLPNG
jgi:hypothetical protein